MPDTFDLDNQPPDPFSPPTQPPSLPNQPNRTIPPVGGVTPPNRSIPPVGASGLPNRSVPPISSSNSPHRTNPPVGGANVPHRTVPPMGGTNMPAGGPLAPNRTVPPITVSGGQLPTEKASDLLKGNAKGGIGGATTPDSAIDRRATPFDDFASGIFVFSTFLFFAGLVYLLWGMCSGSFADPNWTSVLTHDDHLRIMGNVQLCGQVMWVVLVISALSFLFLYYHEDYAGYVMLGLAVLLLVVVPYGIQALFNSKNYGNTTITNGIIAQLGTQAWLVGIPGLLLAIFNLFKSFLEGLSEAKARRSTLQFGHAAVKDIKPRNQFLGPCWNLPFCKEGVRAKCPIFVAKRGPCWRNKRGCMCDQTILLIAQAPNWKQSVAATVGKLENKRSNLQMPELPPQPQLSRAAKNERCRQCVIYNVHQEQKYKLLVGVLLAASLGTLYVFQEPLLTFTGDLFTWGNTMVGKFSITGDTSPLFANGAPPFVEWLMLGSVVLIIMAYLLRGVEYLCFRLKI